MKVGPKSSLRPFLLRALQFFFYYLLQPINFIQQIKLPCLENEHVHDTQCLSSLCKAVVPHMLHNIFLIKYLQSSYFFRSIAKPH